MKYFLTSDFHLGHFNIIRYTGRPFRDLAHMNSELIRRFNERVQKDDLVYILGDFCFKNTPKAAIRGEGAAVKWTEYWHQLNGIKTLVAGNHDSNNGAKTLLTKAILEISNLKIGICHRLEDAIGGKVDFWAVGHSHDAWRTTVTSEGKIAVCVCVEQWNYYPADIHEVIGRYCEVLKNRASNNKT